MQKYKLIFYYTCLICIVISLSACSMDIDNPESNNAITNSGPFTLVTEYSTISDLEKDASEIVEIEVVSQETIIYEGLPFTISKVTIIESLKGKYNKGDSIQIIETGGEFTPLDVLGKPLPKSTLEVAGIPVLEVNAHEIIFLTEFEGPQVSSQTYVPLGVYQGRFKINESGSLVQQAPKNEKIKEIKKLNKKELTDTISKLN